MINLTVDGKKVTVDVGSTVLDAARKAEVDIPTLCHSKHLIPYGACRMCTVEVGRNGNYRLQASCAYPAEEGLEVRTDSERVVRGRRMMAELLLGRCPNVPAVQVMAAHLGVEKSRFSPKKDTCILCGQCVRICQEVVGAGAIGFAGRGVVRKIMPPFDKHSEQCIACGVCTYICPTGHVQMESQTRLQWQQSLPPQARECRFVRMGFYAHKICPNDFHCEDCEIDQQMEDLLDAHPAVKAHPAAARQLRQVAGFDFLPYLYYTRGHVWVQFIGGLARIGMDDLARAVVGRADDIRTPPVGARLGAGEVVFEVLVGDRKLPLLSPLAGTVLSVNPHLAVDPALSTRQPFGRGWVLLVQGEKLDAVESVMENLLTGYEAERWLTREAERVTNWSHPLANARVSQAGRLLDNLPQQLDPIQWKAFTGDFFGKY